MIFLSIPYILQLLLIIHAWRSGRANQWLWLLIMVPYIAGLAYLILEVLPELSRGGAGAAQNLAKNLIPSREIKRLELIANQSPSIENKRLLGDAFRAQGNHEKALEIYASIASLPFGNDASLQLIMAKTMVDHGSPGNLQAALAILKTLDKNQELTLLQDQGLYLWVQWKVLHLPEALDQLQSLQRASKNFELGYLLAQVYHSQGNTEAIQGLVMEMKDQIALHKNLRKSMGTHWIRRTQGLLTMPINKE